MRAWIRLWGLSPAVALLLFTLNAQGQSLESAKLKWAKKPDASLFERYFPRNALNQGISGMAILCCRVLNDGRLSCAVGAETPDGEGFGQAAINISTGFRLDKSQIADAQSAPPLEIPIRMLVDGYSTEYLDKWGPQHKGVCTAPLTS